MKKLLLLAFLLFTFFNSRASHAAGMEITYEWIGGNTYNVDLKFYRDCSGINVSTSFNLNYSSSSCGYNSSTMMNLIDSSYITPNLLE